MTRDWSLCKTDMGTSSNNRRITWIDAAKTIGMLLVIHNHFNMDYGNNGVKIVIASFHMPLFFVLTGLTTKAPNSFGAFKIYVIKRVAAIMLPFFLWSVIFIDRTPKGLLYMLYGSNPSIGRAGGIGGSWFFPCFFASCMIVAVISLITAKKHTPVVLGVAAAVCFVCSYALSLFRPEVGFPLSFDVSLSGAGFIMLGMMFRQSQLFAKTTGQKTTIKLLFCLVCIAVCAGLAILNFPSYDNDYRRPVMALAYYGIFPIFVLTGIIGSLAVILLAMLVDGTPVGKITAKIGAQTFTILMMQQFMIDAAEKVLQKLSIALFSFYPLLFACVILLAGYLAAVIISVVYPNLAGRHMLEELLDRSCKNQK